MHRGNVIVSTFTLFIVLVRQYSFQYRKWRNWRKIKKVTNMRFIKKKHKLVSWVPLQNLGIIRLYWHIAYYLTQAFIFNRTQNNHAISVTSQPLKCYHHLEIIIEVLQSNFGSFILHLYRKIVYKNRHKGNIETKILQPPFIQSLILFWKWTNQA